MQPEPAVSLPQYLKEISSMIAYPKELAGSETMGTTFVEFVIRKDGSLTDFRIVKSAYEPLDNEVIRVIKEGPKWKPGEQNGNPKNVRFILPIKVRVPK